MSQAIKVFIKHLSDVAWSNYTAADYSIEQWHAACLIHQHEGPPTSKSQCKLPVKTPGGAVNKNGVHAAAAALAGARGGVHASSEEKASAARALRGYYRQMNEKPPPSLMEHSNIIKFIEHHGIKGMKWGVRRSRTGRLPGSETGKQSRKTARTLGDTELKNKVERLRLEDQYIQLQKSTSRSEGKKFASELLKGQGKALLGAVAGTAATFAVQRALKAKFPDKPK